MSWSLSASGSRTAAKRVLDAQKIYGTASEEEQGVFDRVRSMLKEIVDMIPDPSAGPGEAVTIVKASASGHGKQVSSFSVSYEQHALV